MSQLANQSDLPTDTYSMIPSTPSLSKSGINASQKKVLGISAATMLLGGAAWAVAQRTKEYGKVTDTPTAEPGTPDSPTVELPDDVDVAGKVTDNMSFEQAFTTARQEVGMGGVFSWHGHWYNTFEKEEWNSLSLEQRQEYTENILGEKLPVKPYGSPVPNAQNVASAPTADVEPTIIEGHLNGQRVMGLDFDRDGVIDTIVLDGADGYTYRVVDARGDDGLDTLYRYDSLNGELVEVERIDEPFVLSNDDFNQGLEASMSKEVVDSILEPDVDVLVETPNADAVETPDVQGSHEHGLDDDEADEQQYLADSHEPDDTYVNNGDVRDMDE
ncbi:hypothetical protein [Spirosoma radiotolerans]|uniref:Uncharacterized protein n=1 Tax=Spirosoma radiotolerans TaxID=1379870 RepID=A0A0E3ZX39_9BACT|nr:hypothetical protein [Spirosoma radiotolerans]AKD56150.1 hypothetical protein SD10_15845 [Spirosoma radiotolerans]